MLDLLENQRDRDGVFFYVERHYVSTGYLLIDFLNSNEFDSFSASINLNYDWKERPTMVEIVNYKQKKLREGTVYSISYEVLSELNNRLVIVEDSLIIGFRLELTANDKILFGKPTGFRPSSTNIFGRYNNLKNINFTGQYFNKVTIRNIGQGNWNEIISDGQVKVIFDAGTIYTTKRSDLLLKISGRDEQYQESKPIIVLSHWDVDHYHFLIGFHDETIRAFSHFVFRDALPNLTARKVLGRFRILNENALIGVEPEDPSPLKSSFGLKKYTLSICRQILLFNAFKNGSRNKSGLALSLRTRYTSVVFAGDLDYSQVSDSILPDLCYTCNHYLVVPHHGGKAGKFKYSYSPLNKLKEAIISVGKNPYKPKHPHENNIKSLRAIGFDVIQTNLKTGDYEILL